jgi:thymidylate kinase
MQQLKYWRIEIDGIDKTGKSSLCKYVYAKYDNKYLTQDRGLLSMQAYSTIYGRNVEYITNCSESTLYVLLECDKKDWETRCIATKEAPFSFDLHTKIFREKYDALNCHKLTFNTSKLTFATIADKINEKLVELNDITNL